MADTLRLPEEHGEEEEEEEMDEAEEMEEGDHIPVLHHAGSAFMSPRGAAAAAMAAASVGDGPEKVSRLPSVDPYCLTEVAVRGSVLPLRGYSP